MWSFDTCTTVLRLGAASVAQIRVALAWHRSCHRWIIEELDIDVDDGGGRGRLRLRESLFLGDLGLHLEASSYSPQDSSSSWPRKFKFAQISWL